MHCSHCCTHKLTHAARVATSAASSLHLSAAGSVSTRGGDSPASSQTSEQPSLADVDETAAKPAGAKLGAALKKGGLVRTASDIPQ